MQKLVVTVSVLLCLGGGIAATSVVSADGPPRPGTDESDLDANETATLWSKEPNECSTDEEYVDEHGENRSALHGLGDCTDITFAEPPDTAERWTSYDAESLSSGGSSSSVHPQHAETANGTWIADAHATIFATQPSTIVHQDSNSTPLYLAPEGELYGFVDYWVDVPDDEQSGSTTIEWSLTDHDIRTVRAHQNETVLDESTGEHTPEIDYDLNGTGTSTLTLEAEIEAELERTIIRETDDGTTRSTQTFSDNVTVSSDREVEVYNLTASIYYASYPDDADGVAIYQSQPWHGYNLTEDGDDVVRGVWRYYTARDTDWDTLVHSSESGKKTVNSSAHPVYVRAFPSETGPLADPIREGPQIEEVWGDDSPSPAETLHENVEIDVIDEPYTRSHGLAVRHDEIERNHLEVVGIVRGETGTLVEPLDGTEREVRESDLSVEVIEQNESEATLELTLRDAETGSPISLDTPVGYGPRFTPIGLSTRLEYIEIGDKRVQTDSTGTAQVTLSQPGSYTATYHAGSWRSHNPAYVGDTARVSWHPLFTASGWFSLVFTALWILIPFLVALYTGLKLGSFLDVREEYS